MGSQVIVYEFLSLLIVSEATDFSRLTHVWMNIFTRKVYNSPGCTSPGADLIYYGAFENGVFRAPWFLRKQLQGVHISSDGHPIGLYLESM